MVTMEHTYLAVLTVLLLQTTQGKELFFETCDMSLLWFQNVWRFHALVGTLRLGNPGWQPSKLTSGEHQIVILAIHSSKG